MTIINVKFKLVIASAQIAKVNIIQSNPDNKTEIKHPNRNYTVPLEKGGTYDAFFNIVSAPNTEFTLFQDGDAIHTSKTDPRGRYGQYIWVMV